jgi:hypothetical protein
LIATSSFPANVITSQLLSALCRCSPTNEGLTRHLDRYTMALLAIVCHFDCSFISIRLIIHLFELLLIVRRYHFELEWVIDDIAVELSPNRINVLSLRLLNVRRTQATSTLIGISHRGGCICRKRGNLISSRALDYEGSSTVRVFDLNLFIRVFGSSNNNNPIHLNVYLREWRLLCLDVELSIIGEDLSTIVPRFMNPVSRPPRLSMTAFEV